MTNAFIAVSILSIWMVCVCLGMLSKTFKRNILPVPSIGQSIASPKTYLTFESLNNAAWLFSLRVTFPNQFHILQMQTPFMPFE